jgi:hypothetical protein
MWKKSEERHERSFSTSASLKYLAINKNSKKNAFLSKG